MERLHRSIRLEYKKKTEILIPLSKALRMLDFFHYYTREYDEVKETTKKIILDMYERSQLHRAIEIAGVFWAVSRFYYRDRPEGAELAILSGYKDKDIWLAGLRMSMFYLRRRKWLSFFS